MITNKTTGIKKNSSKFISFTIFCKPKKVQTAANEKYKQYKCDVLTIIIKKKCYTMRNKIMFMAHNELRACLFHSFSPSLAFRGPAALCVQDL